MKILLCLPLLLWCLGLLDHGASGVGSDELSVSVMEGDSVTLNTGVQTNQQDRIRWYFNNTRIAQINRDQSKICTDVQCKEGTERFRDRLKLDHQTGSLNITNTTNTDSGEYKLKIIRGSSDSEKIFSVSVTGVSVAERDEVNEGESVTLYTSVGRKPNDLIKLYFNEILIAEITGDQSQICTDVQCEERFRDRLKLDHQTGSLTITNTTNTDSGEYKLQISNSRFSIMRSFSVSVTAPPDSGLSSAAVGGICAAVILLVAVAAGIYYYCRSKQKGNGTPHNNNPQANGVPEAVALIQRTETAQMEDNGTSHNETGTAQVNDDNGTSHNETGTAQVNDDNGTSHNETETSPLADDSGTSHNESETAPLADDSGTSHNESETAPLADDSGTSHNESETAPLADDSGTSHNESETAPLADDSGTSHNEIETAHVDDDSGTSPSVSPTNGISQ